MTVSYTHLDVYKRQGLNTMKTVGLLCPNAADPYLSQALTYLENAFRSHSYDCLLSCTRCV